MNDRTGNTRTLLAAFTVVGLAASGCSGDSADGPVAAADTLLEASTPTADVAAEETDDADSGERETAERFGIEAGDGPTDSYVSSAMGGVRFEAPESAVVLVAGDHIIVTTQDELEAGNSFGLATIGLTSMLGSGAALESADAYLDAIRGAGVEVVPTGTEVEVLGYELTGYELIGGDDELFLFASERVGAPVQSGFGPSGAGVEFIADTPSGVLVASASDPDGDIETWLPLLGTLVESVEATGPGVDAPLPAGQTIEPADAGEPPPPAMSSDGTDAPAPLGEAFSAVEPGRYELLNFGLPISIEVPEGWFVQPNFPGVVVLTKVGSIGPGDRDLVWINDLRELVPIAGGPIRAGEGRPVADIDAILADPPAGLVFDEVERYRLDAPNGGAMPVVSFRVSVDSSAACTVIDPCDYAFVTSYGFVKQLLSTSANRVWFFAEHPSGPAAVIAQSNLNSDFLTEAAAVMATLELGG